MTRRYDVAVVGAGPAGLSAAVTAAENGARVVVLDENPETGGQIWRRELLEIPPPARPWIERLRRAEVEVLAGASVGWAKAAGPSGCGSLTTSLGPIEAGQAILACGARETFLPFPGWEMPGVLGVGGLQAMVDSGLDVRGREIVLAGSGPLLLQVAQTLRRNGAEVLRVAEQAPFGRLLRFARHLGFARVWQAMTLTERCFRSSSWPVEALGETHVRSVRLRVGKRVEELACDYLAVGFGLAPNLEIALALGCEIEGDAVVVDERQRTSSAGILAAGEICGVKGAPGALADGVCAGYEAVGKTPPRTWRRRRDRERRFADHLARTFTLRDEVRRLGHDETLLCRCEQVPLAAVAPHGDWTAAKLHTRCGMGLCQGRVCGSAARVLFDWKPSSPRPPLVPMPIGSLMANGGGDPSSNERPS